MMGKYLDDDDDDDMFKYYQILVYIFMSLYLYHIFSLFL